MYNYLFFLVAVMIPPFNINKERKKKLRNDHMPIPLITQGCGKNTFPNYTKM
jgi:hypothetical protein